MDLRRLQEWWFHRQGLMTPDPGATAAEVMANSGWIRSVGGANPYLGVFARCGRTPADVNAELERVEIHELPCARGCTYVVPQSDYALALLAGKGMGDAGDMAVARKFLGVTDAEIEALMGRVLEALAGGQMDPRELREPLGAAVRNLGPEGKKRGMTTTLPLALGRLQTEGRIRRVPVDGRLDQQRYRYVIWSPSPLDGVQLTHQEACVELARRYFRWIGPAAPGHFRWFSGFTAKTAKEAMAPLGLVPLEEGSDLLLFPEDREALLAWRPPPDPRFALVGSIDGIAHLRRDAAALMDPEDADRGLPGGGSLRSLQDLPHHAILDRGRLIGLWEYDTAAAEIVWWSSVERTSDLCQAVARTGSMIREFLGDARSFSLDSPESRRPGIERLRAASVHTSA